MSREREHRSWMREKALSASVYSRQQARRLCEQARGARLACQVECRFTAALLDSSRLLCRKARA